MRVLVLPSGGSMGEFLLISPLQALLQEFSQL